MKEEMICNRLVVGIRDTELSQRLQLDSDLTLEKAKKSVRLREAVSEQRRILETPEETRVDQLHFRSKKHPPRGKRPQTHAPPTKAKPAGSEQTRKTCGRCGRGSHPRDKCPAKDAITLWITVLLKESQHSSTPLHPTRAQHGMQPSE